MDSMRAAVLTGHGGNEVISVSTRPMPRSRPGEVLVRIRASGLNRVDLYMRNSGAGINHELPMVMGLDGAGAVEEAEPGSRFAPGDPVVVYPVRTCGRCEFCLRGEEVLCTSARYLGEHIDGTLSDFVCVPEENLVPKPEHLDWVEAASLCVAGLTAWRMIHTKGQVKPGETVLVFGIGGSVSLAALQLLAAGGIRTIVTSRDQAKLDAALKLGAFAGILTDSDGFMDEVMGLTGGRGVDLVIENVGKAVWPQAMRALVRGGRIVTCGATSGDDPSADLRRLFIRQLQVLGSTLGTRSELTELVEFVGRHQVRPHIDSVYSLTRVQDAFDRMEAGRQFGKIGITFEQKSRPE